MPEKDKEVKKNSLCNRNLTLNTDSGEGHVLRVGENDLSLAHTCFNVVLLDHFCKPLI